MEQKEQIELAEKVMEHQIEILNTSFDKMTNYTNLIVIAGYAGFFGIWQITKDYLSPKQAVLSALLMVISIFIFVVFEIYKAYFLGSQARKLNQLIFTNEANKNLQTLVEAFKKYNIEEKKNNLRFIKFYLITFFPTVIFGVSGAGVLVAAFISKLLSGIC